MIKETFFVAFLDDRQEIQKSVLRAMRHAIPKGWDFIACPLMSNPEDYAAWLVREKVLVLLIDQRLDEQPLSSRSAVEYKGHDVIAAVRAVLPDFPIIVVTAVPEDEDLQNHFGDAEDIIMRSQLTKQPKDYMQRFVRLGTRYLEQHRQELSQLGLLAAKSASGKATTSERKRLRALQTKLGLVGDRSVSRDAAIGSLEKEIAKLETVRNKFQTFLRKHRKQAGSKPTKGSRRRRGGDVLEEGR